VRARLAPGGLYVQWAPTPRSVSTFATVFPHGVILRPVGIMIGSNTPITFDQEQLLARLAEPAVAAHLALGRAGCCDWPALIGGIAWRWTTARELDEDALSDLFPRDEFYLNQPAQSAAR
jgi:hypothetical protein